MAPRGADARGCPATSRNGELATQQLSELCELASQFLSLGHHLLLLTDRLQLVLLLLLRVQDLLPAKLPHTGQQSHRRAGKRIRLGSTLISPSSLSVLFIKARSIRNKGDKSVGILFEDKNICVMAIAETWLHTDTGDFARECYPRI